MISLLMPTLEACVAAAPSAIAAFGVAPALLAVPALSAVAWLAALLFCAVAPAYAQEEPEQPPAAGEAPAEAPTPELRTIPVTTGEPAEPQPKDAAQLDTIEVTASKRLKSQRDLPGSVGAIRGDELEKMRAQSLTDYLKLIPGVMLTEFGADEQIPVIRGIASATDQNQFTAQTTGIYLEEMPFNDLFLPLSIPNLNPFDLERVEVLKGPQGTLFGASALAGAIRYILQKPNLGVWQAKASGTVMHNAFSENLSPVGAAALNAPLFGDSAALRVVGLYRRDAGIYDSRPNGGNTRDEKDVDRLDQITGRALLRWDVSDTLKLSALAFAQDTEQDDIGVSDNADDFTLDIIPFPSPTHSKFGGANFTATNDFDWARVFYSGNVLDKDFRNRAQSEAALPNQLGNQQDVSWYNYIRGKISGNTHELRISSPEGGDDSDWEWLVGGALMSYTQEFFQFSPNPGDADSGYYANPPEDREDVPENDQFTSFLYATVDGDASETALFGEVTGRLGAHWEATLGVRAFKTEMEADTLFRGDQINALEPGSTESRAHFVQKEDGINPKASLRYLHDRNIQSYVLVARGFQFGGVQLNPPIANAEQASEAKGFSFGPFDSSVLWNYEVGLRTEWLDRRLRFDLAAFYLDWSDLQITLQVPLNPQPIPAPPGSGIPENVNLDVIVNIAAAHSEGLEAALEILPFPGASFQTSVAWINAVTDADFDPDHPDGPVRAGTRLPGTPRFQWVNAFGYERSLPYFEAWQGEFALTHVHTGEYPNSLRPVKQVGGYDTLDARVSVARPGVTWLPEIGLGVNNLTDTRGVGAYGGDGNATNFYRFIQPRTTLLTLAWSY